MTTFTYAYDKTLMSESSYAGVYASDVVNQTPVIGILSQQNPYEFSEDERFLSTDSYMMAAYVKYLEQAGARVVPLIMGEPEEVTMDKLSKLNGVFFPGGNGDYIDWGRKIFDRVK